ncbi:MAG: hypothetical protein ACYDAR_00870 [Thermomicrobiales bacterium]
MHIVRRRAATDRSAGEGETGVPYDPSRTWADNEEPSPALTPLQPVTAWSGRAVGWVTVFFGFLPGLILSAINWVRLETHKKAVGHLVAGIVAFILYILAVAKFPVSIVAFLLINVGIGYYLYFVNAKDLDEAGGVTKQVTIASAWTAVALGAVCLVVSLLLIVALHPVM